MVYSTQYHTHYAVSPLSVSQDTVRDSQAKVLGHSHGQSHPASHSRIPTLSQTLTRYGLIEQTITQGVGRLLDPCVSPAPSHSWSHASSCVHMLSVDTLTGMAPLHSHRHTDASHALMRLRLMQRGNTWAPHASHRPSHASHRPSHAPLETHS